MYEFLTTFILHFVLILVCGYMNNQILLTVPYNHSHRHLDILVLQTTVFLVHIEHGLML
jgi:hypothetical protein